MTSADSATHYIGWCLIESTDGSCNPTLVLLLRTLCIMSAIRFF